VESNRYLQKHVNICEFGWEAWKLLIEKSLLTSLSEVVYADLHRNQQAHFVVIARHFAGAVNQLKTRADDFLTDASSSSFDQLVVTRPNHRDEVVVSKGTLQEFARWEPPVPQFRQSSAADGSLVRTNEPSWGDVNDHVLHFFSTGEPVECVGCGEQPVVNRRFSCPTCGEMCQHCWQQANGRFHSAACTHGVVKIIQLSEGRPPPGPIQFAHNGIVETRKHRGRDREYLVDFRGHTWTNKDDNWLTAAHLDDDTLADWENAQLLAQRRKRVAAAVQRTLPEHRRKKKKPRSSKTTANPPPPPALRDSSPSDAIDHDHAQPTQTTEKPADGDAAQAGGALCLAQNGATSPATVCPSERPSEEAASPSC
jgi:hypothetical protein